MNVEVMAMHLMEALATVIVLSLTTHLLLGVAAIAAALTMDKEDLGMMMRFLGAMSLAVVATSLVLVITVILV
jgi:hypothetical protein